MLKPVSDHQTVLELTRVAGNHTANVWYDQGHDTVALEVGKTTIHMQASHFFQMHEMMRKAVARLVMQEQPKELEHLKSTNRLLECPEIA